MEVVGAHAWVDGVDVIRHVGVLHAADDIASEAVTEQCGEACVLPSGRLVPAALGMGAGTGAGRHATRLTWMDRNTQPPDLRMASHLRQRCPDGGSSEYSISVATPRLADAMQRVCESWIAPPGRLVTCSEHFAWNRRGVVPLAHLRRCHSPCAQRQVSQCFMRRPRLLPTARSCVVS